MRMSCLSLNPIQKSAFFLMTEAGERSMDRYPLKLGSTFGERINQICTDGSHSLVQSESLEVLRDRVDSYDSDHPIIFVLIHVTTTDIAKVVELIEEMRTTRKMVSFISVFLDPQRRANNPGYAIDHATLIKKGASQVSDSLNDILYTAGEMKKSMSTTSRYACPICKPGGIAHHLDKTEIRDHIFLFHSSEDFETLAKKIPKCPICKLPVHKVGQHLHTEHRDENKPSESELALSTVFPFCLVVCRRKKDGKFLLVNEVAGQGWWLSGGRVNLGETLQQTAIRETKEEAGIDIEIKGILRYEYSPNPKYARMRVIFYAEPVDDDQLPKSVPDYESMGAAYVSVSELDRLPLRGKEPKIWIQYLARGGLVYPAQLLAPENSSISIKGSQNVHSVSTGGTASMGHDDSSYNGMSTNNLVDSAEQSKNSSNSPQQSPRGFQINVPIR